MRILIAEDDVNVRSAVSILLKHQPHLEVAGEAANTQEMLEQVKAQQPDVLILDWSLIDQTPANLAGLRSSSPGLRVIVISGRTEVRPAALEAGADAFVSKGDPPERLLAALQLVRGTTTDSS